MQKHVLYGTDESDGCLKAKHRLKPVDKLIGKVEKVTRGEHPSNAYVVVSIGEHDPHKYTHLHPFASLRIEARVLQ